MAKPSELLTPKRPKLAIVYTLLGALCLGSVGLLQWIDELAVGWLFLLATGLILGLGIVHARLMYKYSGQVSDPDDFGGGLMLTGQLMIAGGVLTAVLYHWIHLDYIFIVVLLAFIFPFLFGQARHYLRLIPPPLYKLWYYPLGEEMPDLDFIDLSQIEVVQFVFHKRTPDTTQTNFTSKAPLDMSLSQLFFIFINDYNEKNARNTIEFINNQRLPYGWLFFREKKWWNRRHYFDPELSFRQNAIQPNELIYAERAALATPLPGKSPS